MAMTAIADQRLTDRDESYRRAHDLRSDQVRQELTWERLEEIMADAPLAQRRAFWTAQLPLLEVHHRFMGRLNVVPIAEPLQDAGAEAIDAQVTKELSR
ncbi:hypothetical protein D9M69_733130 [compost metagenome]